MKKRNNKPTKLINLPYPVDNGEYIEGHGDWKECGCEVCYTAWASKAIGRIAELKQESILLEEKRKERTFIERLFNS